MKLLDKEGFQPWKGSRIPAPGKSKNPPIEDTFALWLRRKADQPELKLETVVVEQRLGSKK